LHHHSYGDEILVQRTIRRNGSSEYRLMSQAGRLVPGGSTRAELQSMLDHFNIAAGNPLSIMTQDMARTFLSGAF
jgi:chromosome segregation ATPase